MQSARPDHHHCPEQPEAELDADGQDVTARVLAGVVTARADGRAWVRRDALA
ncbi:hypothetical protein ACFVJ8_28040 [Streptomyces yangpuensis]|uniref:hypothetical protein n=1 Tax=Streptomyces TaxID=1883 RepID=UPI000B1C27FB|nr:hypothetical protein [Streptomyces sp. NRRL S-378]